MPEPFRALIVDDEEPARRLVREFLEDFPKFTVAGECANGNQARKALERESVDLLFLDINMPGRNGFQVLEDLTHPPEIIFSTAYDQYALEAFEIAAVDYLLKPYDRARFTASVEKALQRLQTAKPQEAGSCLLVRDGHRIIPVRPKDIIWIEAAGDYCLIHLPNEHILSSSSLGELEKRLPSHNFNRVHRSSVINLDFLKSLEKDGEGGMIAHLQGGTQVRVSRPNAARFRDMLV